VTYERLSAAAFLSSPYRIPVIGWMNDLENIQLEDLLAWYETWYAPNNATLVVVGDVQPEEVKRLATKYFAQLKPSKIPALKPRKEVEPLGVRNIEVRVPAQVPMLYMGYLVPSLASAKPQQDAYALEMLANVLDGGSSARLSEELVRGKEIAANASAGYSLTSRLSDLFLLMGTPATGKSIAQLRAALLEQVERLKNTPITKAELEKIKAQVVASAVYEKDSHFYQAMQLGTYETIGLSWKDGEAYVSKIMAVTPEQVQQVARKYLLKDHLVTAELVPLPMDPNKAPRPAPTSGHHM